MTDVRKFIIVLMEVKVNSLHHLKHVIVHPKMWKALLEIYPVGLRADPQDRRGEVAISLRGPMEITFWIGSDYMQSNLPSRHHIFWSENIGIDSASKNLLNLRQYYD
jgi:hypothetical protein